MPKSKHRKMTRNTPKAGTQAPVQSVQTTQAPAGATVIRGQTTPVAPRTASSPYNRASSGKTATLPVIDYVGKELRTIGILTAIVVIIIIVLSFMLR